jgi:hypothetical protein
VERRRRHRYPVRLGCRVTPLMEPAATFSGETLNMSSRGLLVSLVGTLVQPATLRTGRLARVVLDLPRVPYFRDCWLACVCRVVRGEEKDSVHMLAFEVLRYRFSPSPGTASEA